MAAFKVLLMQDARAGDATVEALFKKRGYQVASERALRPTLKRIATWAPDLIVLDAVSLGGNGTRLCRRLTKPAGDTPILLVVSKRQRVAADCGASAIIKQPFTLRKLWNTAVRLLPAEGGDTLQVGPIRLNLTRRRVSCGGRDQKVTPKQARLLEMFLRAPGQLLTRKAIIKHVWDTDYTGDTRTLDVHISWLRSVVEPNPRRPRYIQTVRGQGYQLNLPG
jgi:DNA-binding response OmpR family regulator